MRVWAHRVLGALGWVALVLLAVWRRPEVARTVACSIVDSLPSPNATNQAVRQSASAA